MYKCTTCESLFYSTVDTANHIEAQHPDISQDEFVEVQYRCKVCGQMFKHWIDCRNHGHRDHGVQRMECAEVIMESESTEAAQIT